ncbi:MAG: sugar ABC transporter permease [Clostridiales bacterium]|nr:sugar ABC transporter permease [Clostridiales bacterium]
MTSEEIVADKGKITADEVAALTPPKSVKRSKISYERRKGLYGYGFIGLWLIGTIYFFILPTINSLIYSFNKTAPKTGYMEKTFIGLENYVNAVVNDSNYTQNLTSVLGEVALKTPLIIIFSIFVAIILNQKFKGRTFARAVFFLPVIIATGPVFDIINGNMNTGGYAGGAEQFSTLFETDLVNQLLSFLGIYNISESVTNIITTLTDSIFNLIWNAGIQILLFIAALQNIPHSAKEAAQMEGATSWEFFWKITIPYISPMILASLVYTVVDSFVDPTNAVMQQVTTQASSWKHGYSAAMAWFYFGIVAIVLAIIVLIVNKFVYYEVE